ncbi:MAG: glycosyltransferase family 2 protein [Monoglobales bacterium]
MLPLITLVIPTYNNEATIKRCLDSVLSQTQKGIEIIVVNDGSTDKTQEILEEMSSEHKSIKVINMEKQSGQGIARNVGLSHARGQYIGFVDADDTISADMYENMLKKALENDADIVQCNIANIFPDGKYIFQLPKFDRVVHVKNRKAYFNNYLFRTGHSYECCNKLIRKSFLIDNNIKFESNDKVFSEDLLFNLDMAAKMNTIVFMSEPYYNYYQYKDSHSKTNDTQKIEKLCVLFDTFYKREKELRFECAKIAVLIIMINLSHILKEREGIESAKAILRRRDIKKYLAESFLKTRKIRHKILMLLLLVMPVKIKIFIIMFYYSRLR